MSGYAITVFWAQGASLRAVGPLKSDQYRRGGPKGKKLTTPEDRESEAYREARRNRSAVESLMPSRLNDGFAFGELGRRGIDAVGDELLEKVLAYNFCRIILMKKRLREELEQSA